jgi:hypothetical protein
MALKKLINLIQFKKIISYGAPKKREFNLGRFFRQVTKASTIDLSVLSGKFLKED